MFLAQSIQTKFSHFELCWWTGVSLVLWYVFIWIYESILSLYWHSDIPDPLSNSSRFNQVCFSHAVKRIYNSLLSDSFCNCFHLSMLRFVVLSPSSNYFFSSLTCIHIYLSSRYHFKLILPSFRIRKSFTGTLKKYLWFLSTKCRFN